VGANEAGGGPYAYRQGGSVIKTTKSGRIKDSIKNQ